MLVSVWAHAPTTRLPEAVKVPPDTACTVKGYVPAGVLLAVPQVVVIESAEVEVPGLVFGFGVNVAVVPTGRAGELRTLREALGSVPARWS